MISMTVRRSPGTPGLAGGFLLAALLTIAPASAFAQPAAKGQWAPVFDWPNIAIHTHVLPNGTVLFWSRREKGEGLDPHNCTPRLWDPAKQANAFTDLPQPGFNLFCSGHTFLADGRLLVVGGHQSDSHGERHATIFDPNALNALMNPWTRIDDMNRGRWYPTTVTLPDGNAVVSSGSDEQAQTNDVQQVEKNGHWTSIVNFNGLPLYPRMHVGPNGQVFMSGPLHMTQYLDPTGAGQWTVVGNHVNQGVPDYAPSVMYDAGKVLYVGRGLPPSKAAETIDLTANPPAWRATADMSIGRRHHNATILPDGTVLVTGGTSGNGGPNPFNDESQPVKLAELWDPSVGKWSPMASEDVPRLYHSTAVLLPDARVLSAGGGEYRMPDGSENDPANSHKDGQIFSPPYLFHGARPDITSAPGDVTYGQAFDVGTSAPDQVGMVSWIRLSSVTHAFNQNQRLNFLKFTPDANKLTVSAPANANVCPPGHYMLFVLNKDKIPSVAKIVTIH
jgi:galactose oxidase